MAATIIDVARQAGVSIATVSRVIHGSPLVNDATRQRVVQAMEALSYSPNAVARGLVTRHTQAIGLVVTSLADPFFPPIIQGVEETALDHGYSVFLCTSNNDPARELAVVRQIRERRIDAIIIASSRVGALYQAHLQEIRVPLVLVNNEQGGDYTYSVGTDDVSGGYMAASYLLSLGHHDIGYIHGPLARRSTHQRQRSFERALQEHGVASDMSTIVEGDGQPAGGQRAMQELGQRAKRPGAVFCFNDLTALGAMRAVRAGGLTVPGDISVIGYDDIALAAFAEPPLTTVAQQTYQLGRRAMLLALDLLGGQPATSEILPAMLVPRESCAHPQRQPAEPSAAGVT